MIKIEFDLPEFKKELKIEVNIIKDGEGVVSYSTSSSPDDDTVTNEKLGDEQQKSQPDEKTLRKKPSKKSGGNLMGIEL